MSLELQENISHSLNGKDATGHSKKGRGPVLDIDNRQQMVYVISEYDSSLILGHEI